MKGIIFFTMAALLAVPTAFAQDAERMSADHERADTTKIGALVALHLGMMADPTIHAVMEADTELRAAMSDLMPAMEHGDVDEMDDANDSHEAMQHEMVKGIEEHLATLSADERAAAVKRAADAHQNVLANPVVWERVAANPELLAQAHAVLGDGMDS